MSKQCMAESQLGQSAIKPFQGMILQFIQNYQLLNKKTSDNHHGEGKREIRLVYGNSTAGYNINVYNLNSG